MANLSWICFPSPELQGPGGSRGVEGGVGWRTVLVLAEGAAEEKRAGGKGKEAVLGRLYQHIGPHMKLFKDIYNLGQGQEVSNLDVVLPDRAQRLLAETHTKPCRKVHLIED